MTLTESVGWHSLMHILSVILESHIINSPYYGLLKLALSSLENKHSPIVHNFRVPQNQDSNSLLGLIKWSIRILNIFNDVDYLGG